MAMPIIGMRFGCCSWPAGGAEPAGPALLEGVGLSMTVETEAVAEGGRTSTPAAAKSVSHGNLVLERGMWSARR